MPSRKQKDAKLTALQKTGTANPRPDDVRDPLFDSGAFFDRRDIVQVKYEMLRGVSSDGKSVSEAATLFGLSRPSFYKAREDFERDGLAGLLPLKRGPRGPHKATPEVIAFMQQALSEDPQLDANALAVRVEKELGCHLHPRTIARHLARSKKKHQ